ncbi:hypothetical protein [Streptomyces sp. PSKA30]|uniref:hypothetical protein n=1 Tax=Streptomyces sp. PSKA30 TaxID=2874597 RepID=UPI001CD17AA5|nr:hypothetical protein [Streptomyces sp. PSKA30]MBZ9637864.1 hypothetical protein [Streptomyces sp. PSKA30]
MGSRVAAALHEAGGFRVVQDPAHVVVNDERLLELPGSLDWAEGSALTVNCLTAYCP